MSHQRCKDCQMLFSDPAMILQHPCFGKKQHLCTVLYNKEGETFSCSLCSVRLQENEFTEHLQFHFTKHPYYCQKCSIPFSCQTLLFDHIKASHNSNYKFQLAIHKDTKSILEKAKRQGKAVFKPSYSCTKPFYASNKQLNSSQSQQSSQRNLPTTKTSGVGHMQQQNKPEGSNLPNRPVLNLAPTSIVSCTASFNRDVSNNALSRPLSYTASINRTPSYTASINRPPSYTASINRPPSYTASINRPPSQTASQNLPCMNSLIHFGTLNSSAQNLFQHNFATISCATFSPGAALYQNPLHGQQPIQTVNSTQSLLVTQPVVNDVQSEISVSTPSSTQTNCPDSSLALEPPLLEKNSGTQGTNSQLKSSCPVTNTSMSSSLALLCTNIIDSRPITTENNRDVLKSETCQTTGLKDSKNYDENVIFKRSKLLFCKNCKFKFKFEQREMFLKHIWTDLQKEIECCSTFSITCSALVKYIEKAFRENANIVLCGNEIQLKSELPLAKTLASEDISNSTQYKTIEARSSSATHTNYVNTENSEMSSIETTVTSTSNLSVNISRPIAETEGQTSCTTTSDISSKNKGSRCSLLEESYESNKVYGKNYYACGFEGCEFSSHKESILRTHLVMMHLGEKLTCCYCGFSVLTADSFLSHLNSHGSNKEFQGFIVSFLEEKVRTLMEKSITVIVTTLKCFEKSSNYTCESCNSVFESINDLENHLKGSFLNIFSCQHCNSKFFDKQACKIHIKDVHKNQTNFQNFSKVILCKDRKKYSIERSEKDSETAENFPSIPPTKNALNSSKESLSETNQNAILTNVFPEVSSPQKVVDPKDKKLENFLQKNVSVLQEFLQNLYTKEGKYFFCNKCNKMFSNLITLLRHIFLCQGNVAIYTCSFCSEGFAHRGDMKNHYLTDHKDQKFLGKYTKVKNKEIFLKTLESNKSCLNSTIFNSMLKEMVAFDPKETEMEMSSSKVLRTTKDVDSSTICIDSVSFTKNIRAEMSNFKKSPLLQEHGDIINSANKAQAPAKEICIENNQGRFSPLTEKGDEVFPKNKFITEKPIFKRDADHSKTVTMQSTGVNVQEIETFHENSSGAEGKKDKFNPLSKKNDNLLLQNKSITDRLIFEGVSDHSEFVAEDSLLSRDVSLYLDNFGNKIKTTETGKDTLKQISNNSKNVFLNKKSITKKTNNDDVTDYSDPLNVDVTHSSDISLNEIETVSKEIQRTKDKETLNPISKESDNLLPNTKYITKNHIVDAVVDLSETDIMDSVQSSNISLKQLKNVNKDIKRTENNEETLSKILKNSDTAFPNKNSVSYISNIDEAAGHSENITVDSMRSSDVSLKQIESISKEIRSNGCLNIEGSSNVQQQNLSSDFNKTQRKRPAQVLGSFNVESKVRKTEKSTQDTFSKNLFSVFSESLASGTVLVEDGDKIEHIPEKNWAPKRKFSDVETDQSIMKNIFNSLQPRKIDILNECTKTCILCGVGGFRNVNLMKDHIKKKHNDYRACGHCTAVYFNKRTLLRHLNYVHCKKRKTFRCLSIDLVFKSEENTAVKLYRSFQTEKVLEETGSRVIIDDDLSTNKKAKEDNETCKEKSKEIAKTAATKESDLTIYEQPLLKDKEKVPKGTIPKNNECYRNQKEIFPQKSESFRNQKETTPQNSESFRNQKETNPQNNEIFRNQKEIFPQNSENFRNQKETTPQNSESFRNQKEYNPQNNESFRNQKETNPQNNESFRNQKETISQNNESFRKQKETNPQNNESFRNQKETFPQNSENFRNQKETIPQNSESFRNQKEYNPQKNESFRNQKETNPQNNESFRNQKETISQNNESFRNQKETIPQNKDIFRNQNECFPQNTESFPNQKEKIPQSSERFRKKKQTINIVQIDPCSSVEEVEMEVVDEIGNYSDNVSQSKLAASLSDTLTIESVDDDNFKSDRETCIFAINQRHKELDRDVKEGFIKAQEDIETEVSDLSSTPIKSTSVLSSSSTSEKKTPSSCQNTIAQMTFEISQSTSERESTEQRTELKQPNVDAPPPGKFESCSLECSKTTNVRFFNCPFCEKKSSSEFVFRLHLSTHGTFKYTSKVDPKLGILFCPKCGYFATSQNNLANHIESHLDDRQYACSLCNKDDHKKNQIVSHLLKVHGEKNNKLVIDRNKTKVVIRPEIVDFDVKVRCINILEQGFQFLYDLVTENDVAVLELGKSVPEEWCTSNELFEAKCV